ncbi:MAG: DUF1361 domain-containing protein [Verrucomicrobiales bacterium]|nr:DUF1361 domain-containing protein [Verrucomicrobiales bacterium]
MNKIRSGGRDLGLLSLILLACAWCVLLWMVRAWRTESFQLFYFVYNLALGVIPLVFSTLVVFLKKRRRILPVLAVWLLFFPNAPYLLTDLIHLRPRADAPFWYDWLLMLSFAGTGFLVGCFSLFQVHRRLIQWWGSRKAWVAVIGIWGLCALGMYLGRFVRWNSWDIATRPFAFFQDVFTRITNPLDHPVMVAYSGGLGLILLAGYVAVASGWLAAFTEREMASSRPDPSPCRPI